MLSRVNKNSLAILAVFRTKFGQAAAHTQTT